MAPYAGVVVAVDRIETGVVNIHSLVSNAFKSISILIIPRTCCPIKRVPQERWTLESHTFCSAVSGNRDSLAHSQGSQCGSPQLNRRTRSRLPRQTAPPLQLCL